MSEAVMSEAVMSEAVMSEAVMSEAVMTATSGRSHRVSAMVRGLVQAAAAQQLVDDHGAAASRDPPELAVGSAARAVSDTVAAQKLLGGELALDSLGGAIS